MLINVFHTLLIQWQLGIDASEITYDKCRETFTLTIKNKESHVIASYKDQIKVYYTVDLFDGLRYAHGLSNLLNISPDEEILCRVSIDIPDT